MPGSHKLLWETLPYFCFTHLTYDRKLSVFDTLLCFVTDGSTGMLASSDGGRL